MSGTVVLIDRENLIVETADGDRAFALDGETRLPAVLRDSDDWGEIEGFPVEVVFRPGADGELRIVESLSLLPVESQETAEPEAESLVAGAVPAAGGGVAHDVRTAALTTAVAPAGAAQAGDEPAVALRPGEPGTTAGPAAGDGAEAPAGPAVRELPGAASRLPWVALVGLLALGCALGLRTAGRLGTQPAGRR